MKKLLLVLAMVAAMALALATASTALAGQPVPPGPPTAIPEHPPNVCELSHGHHGCPQ